MDPYLLMEMKKSSFSKNDLKIYQTVLDDPELILRHNIVDFSAICSVSQPTVTRFCKKLGYDKYVDFKYDLYRHQRTNVASEKPASDEIIMFETYSRLIQDMKTLIHDQDLLDLANLISGYKHIYTTGIMQSLLSAKLLQTNLNKLSYYAVTLDNTEFDDISHYCDEHDLFIIFSVRAGKSALKKLVEAKDDHSLKSDLCLITMNPDVEEKDRFKKIFVLPPGIRRDYPTRLENQVVFFIFIDILCTYLAKLAS